LAAFACSLLAPLTLVQGAAASYGIAVGASGPALRVDAKGNAEVTWTESGKKMTFVVPKAGAGYHGALPDPNVFQRTRIALPLAVVTGRTPDGTQWALQQLVVSGRPPSLDLSRWHGAPTKLTLTLDGTRLRGSASFGGRPVSGSSPTPAGKAVRAYVYLECFGCPGAPNGWTLMLGVPPKADGSFSVYLRSSWVGKQYRATLAGQNVDGALAPDAQTVVTATP
jgi:hypothetical protein